MFQHNFIGRQEELSKLELLLRKRTSSLVVLKGRRRIGKSRLIAEFGKNRSFYIFTGLAPERGITAQTQRQEFARQLGEQFQLPGLKGEDWGDLFSALWSQIKTGRIILSFDEISWMGMGDPTFLGKLKNAWDNQFSTNPQLVLILCGSISAWIEHEILGSTGFYGRPSLVLTLEELPLNQCNQFWQQAGGHISAYEKFKFLAVTGGVPRYLEELIPSLSAEDNLRQLCFEKEGLLFNEYRQIFSRSFLKKSENYRQIVQSILNGNKTYQQICQSTGLQSSGYLSEYLEELILAGYIQRDFTWHIATGEQSSLSIYRIRDNYLRFYLRYIESNTSQIIAGSFVGRSMTSLSGWDSIMGLQFENLVLNNRALVKQRLNIKPEDVIFDNPFFRKKRKTQVSKWII